MDWHLGFERCFIINIMTKLSKLIVILGPTTTGKTKMATKLCQRYNGEVISADSKQVYKYMSIGTDIPNGRWQNNQYLVDNIPHYMMNCIKPDQEFNLANFKSQVEKLIFAINKKGKIPFLVGGTGLYISAIVDNWSIPKVMPDKKLRQSLERKSLKTLVSILKEKDPKSAGVIDLNNPRRVLRALEVILQSGKSFVEQRQKNQPLFDILQIGLQRSREEINERINSRVDQMIEAGLIREIKQLLNKGYSWNLPSMNSLGYRQFKDYLNNKQTLEEATIILKQDTRRYAKRQITWFKRDKNINWIEAEDIKQATKLIKNF